MLVITRWYILWHLHFPSNSSNCIGTSLEDSSSTAIDFEAAKTFWERRAERHGP